MSSVIEPSVFQHGSISSPTVAANNRFAKTLKVYPAEVRLHIYVQTTYTPTKA